MIDIVMHRKRLPRIAAVDAGAGCVHKVLDGGVAAALEKIGEAGKIARDVGLRMRKRMAHARLRSEMQDALRALPFKEVPDFDRICDIQLKKAESGMRRQLSQSRFLQLYVVVVAQDVEADNFVDAR